MNYKYIRSLKEISVGTFLYKEFSDYYPLLVLLDRNNEDDKWEKITEHKQLYVVQFNNENIVIVENIEKGSTMCLSLREINSRLFLIEF